MTDDRKIVNELWEQYLDTELSGKILSTSQMDELRKSFVSGAYVTMALVQRGIRMPNKTASKVLLETVCAELNEEIKQIKVARKLNDRINNGN